MLESFRSRLVLSNLLITLVGLLVVVFVFTSVLTDRNAAVKKDALAADSRAISAQVEALYARHGAKKELISQIVSFSRTLKVRVIVLRPDGGHFFDSARSTPYFTGSWHPLDRKALADAKDASNELKSGNLVVFQAPIRGSKRPDGGAVLIVAGVSDVQPGLNSLWNVFLIVLGAALLVWLVLGLYSTYSLFRPLLRINAATAQMARGDYEVRVPARGNGEIARLATGFNYMAEQVQRTNRALRDFVANVSHDLRTPLTLISGFSQALLDGTVQSSGVEEASRVIHEEASKMQRMVDDLLQLTRLESGLLTFRRQPVAVRPFVQQAIDRILHLHEGRPMAELRNAVKPDTPLIDVDGEHLERALRNLLDNALRYTPPDGRVSVSAGVLDTNWVRLSVSDTGAGIPAEDLSRIFERFYRADKSRERASGNSGLGLAIVQEIVEGHGGQVTVESEMGKGTIFHLKLPRAMQPTTAHESAQATRESLHRPAHG